MINPSALLLPNMPHMQWDERGKRLISAVMFDCMPCSQHGNDPDPKCDYCEGTGYTPDLEYIYPHVPFILLDNPTVVWEMRVEAGTGLPLAWMQDNPDVLYVLSIEVLDATAPGMNEDRYKLSSKLSTLTYYDTEVSNDEG